MKNEELKKKIIEIISPYVVERWHEHIADALIVAGIGDVKEAEMERKAYEVAASQYMIEFETQKYWREVAEHHAEVAERAGKIAASKVFDYAYEEAVAQAEKELAEEGKDD